MGCKASKYERKYDSANVDHSIPFENVADRRQADTRFFFALRHRMPRDFVVLVDRSESMVGSRWESAREAVMALTMQLKEFTLIFFSNTPYTFTIKQNDLKRVHELFLQHHPSGGTMLVPALELVFEKHFSGSSGSTSVLILTDGMPYSPPLVLKTIEKATRSLGHPSELALSFVQVGHDKDLERFFAVLHDDVRKDVVDARSSTEMRGLSFDDYLKESIRPSQ